jgi:hypothetical protein
MPQAMNFHRVTEGLWAIQIQMFIMIICNVHEIYDLHCKTLHFFLLRVYYIDVS